MRISRRTTKPAQDAERYVQLIDSVANGDGFTTEIRGVKIAKCDQFGKTDADYRLELARVYHEQEVQLASASIERAEAAEKRVAELEVRIVREGGTPK